MIDQTAINRLLDLGASINSNSALPSDAILVPPNYTLVSTEKFQSDPSRFRRTFTTPRLSNFLRYVEKHSNSASALFIADDVSKVVAVLNHGSETNPLWGDNKAVLALEHTPEVKALLGACKRNLSQQEFIDFIEDWTQRGVIQPLDADGVLIPSQTAIAALRRIKIEAKGSTTVEQGPMRAARSSMEEIEAKGADDMLPYALRLVGSVYPETSARTVVARISILTSADKPQFLLRVLEWDWHLAELAKEIEEHITLNLPTQVQVFVGSSIFGTT